MILSMIEIKSTSGATLYASNATGVRQAVQEARAAYANLRGADLRGADLRGAYLRGANLLEINK